MPAVRADQVGRSGRRLADRSVPGGGEQVGVGGPGRPPQPLPTGPGVGVGPAGVGVGQPAARTADQQEPDVLGPRPGGERRCHRGVEAGLEQRLAAPRARLLDQQPPLRRRGGGRRRSPRGRAPAPSTGCRPAGRSGAGSSGNGVPVGPGPPGSPAPPAHRPAPRSSPRPPSCTSAACRPGAPSADRARRWRSPR